MLQINHKIEIGSKVSTSASEISIESSFNTYTDTAIITFAQNSLKKDSGKAIFVGENAVFKIGEAVKIYMGYDQDLKEVFRGYISNIKIEYPIVVECQDASWLLKQSEVRINMQNVSIKDLVAEMLKQAKAGSKYASEIEKIKLIAPDAILGDIKTEGQRAVSFVGLLEELKNTYSLISFFVEGNLYVSFGGATLNDVKEPTEVEITFEKNVISHNLQYQLKDEVPLGVKCVCMYPDNTKAETFVGDQGGSYITLTYYNILPKASDTQKIAELERFATAELEKARFDGYVGAFETFGRPLIKPADRVVLNTTRKELQERDGIYQAVSVSYSIGFGGFRQNVELGRKLL